MKMGLVNSLKLVDFSLSTELSTAHVALNIWLLTAVHNTTFFDVDKDEYFGVSLVHGQGRNLA